MVERQPILLHCRFIMSYMDDNMLKCTLAGNINLTVQTIACQVRELKNKADTNYVFVMYTCTATIFEQDMHRSLLTTL